MIKVLIVNDSFMCQQMIKRTIKADPELETVGIANNGKEGVHLVQTRNPDVVLMDINMPEMGGVEATRQIMSKHPLPILVVTGTFKAHMSSIYDCLNSGALEAIKTPTPDDDQGLISRIKVVSELKTNLKPESSSALSREEVLEPTVLTPRPKRLITGLPAKKVIAIGASTGGPQTLLKILEKFPEDFPATFLIVQHIDEDFSVGFAQWLDKNCELSIFSGVEGDRLVCGVGYVGTGGRNLIAHNGFRVGYQRKEKESLISPSIDICFKSVAEQFGSRAIGVLLTGMGQDGAQGLKKIREAGGKTIAQDEATSLIYGMPKAAKEIDAAEYILPVDEISQKIVQFVEGAKKGQMDAA